MTLHEAIINVLKAARKPLTTREIADELNRIKTYQKRDGSLITAFQIHGRTRNYPQLFDRDKSMVSLKGDTKSISSVVSEGTVKKTQDNKSIKMPANSIELENYLLDESNFKEAEIIDGKVPNTPGLYSIRIINIDALPNPFHSELEKRGHNILYIGIASQSLNRRMLNQELRANGHGTFFRSLGAVLGYRPPFNSLADKKNKRNYKFSVEDKTKIIQWINQNLLINWVEKDSGLEEMESTLILKYKPLLNIAKNPLALDELSKLRNECVEIANGRINKKVSDEKEHSFDKEGIQQILWKAMDILRGSLRAESFYLVNFFMVLKRNNILNDNLLQAQNIKLEFKSILKNSKDKDSNALWEIFQNFERYFDEIPERRFHEVLSLINSINFSIISKIEFGEIFEGLSLLINNSVGKLSGEFTQPKELTQLMQSFIPLNENVSIFNPFAGFASFALDLPNGASYFGQELNRYTWAIARLRMLAHDCPEEFVLSNENTFDYLEREDNQKFDSIIYNPPFNLKFSNISNEFDLRHIVGGSAYSYLLKKNLERLNFGGKIIFLASNSFLFSQRNDDVELRRFLIDNGHIETVISLPSGIFKQTGIPSVLIVLKKDQENKNVALIDASNFFTKKDKRDRKLDVDRILEQVYSNELNDFKHFVSKDLIEQNEYNLNIGRYFLTDIVYDNSIHKVALGDILSYVPPQRVNDNISFKFIRIRDLSNNPFSPNLIADNMEIVSNRRNASLLTAKTLLLATRWKSFKATYYSGDYKDLYYASPDILTFNVDEKKVNIEFLVHELHKDYVIKQLELYSTGSTIPNINRRDLLSIKISLPSLDEQINAVLNLKNESLSKEEEKLISLREEYGVEVADQNSFLRHQIAGRLKNARGAFKNVLKIVDGQLIGSVNGLYQLKNAEVSKNTFGDYLKMIERDLNSIHQAVLRTGKEIELTDSTFKDIDIIDFVTVYFNELKARVAEKYSLKLFVDEESKEDNEVRNVLVKGDPDLLRQLFDNIIENAEKHAFHDNGSSKNRVDIDVDFAFGKMEASITISNTGIPFPTNFSWGNFIRKGGKAGEKSGDGIGGWYINEIMKKHKGRVEFINETDPSDGGIGGDFVSTFQLYFPIEIEKYD